MGASTNPVAQLTLSSPTYQSVKDRDIYAQSTTMMFATLKRYKYIFGNHAMTTLHMHKRKRHRATPSTSTVFLINKGAFQHANYFTYPRKHPFRKRVVAHSQPDTRVGRYLTFLTRKLLRLLSVRGVILRTFVVTSIHQGRHQYQFHQKALLWCGHYAPGGVLEIVMSLSNEALFRSYARWRHRHHNCPPDGAQVCCHYPLGRNCMTM